MKGFSSSGETPGNLSSPRQSNLPPSATGSPRTYKATFVANGAGSNVNGSSVNPKNRVLEDAAPAPPAKRFKTSPAGGGTSGGRNAAPNGSLGAVKRSLPAFLLKRPATGSRFVTAPAGSVSSPSSNLRRISTPASVAAQLRGSRGQEPPSSPSAALKGFRTTLENERLVYVIDDDSDDAVPVRQQTKQPQKPVATAGRVDSPPERETEPPKRIPVTGQHGPAAGRSPSVLRGSPQGPTPQPKETPPPSPTKTPPAIRGSFEGNFSNADSSPGKLKFKSFPDGGSHFALNGATYGGRGSAVGEVSYLARPAAPAPPAPSSVPRAVPSPMSALHNRPTPTKAKRQQQQQPRKQAQQAERATHRAANSLNQKDFSFVRFSTLGNRPYLQAEHRNYVLQSSQKPLGNGLPLLDADQCLPIIHIDFTTDEIQTVLDVARKELEDFSTPTRKISKASSTPARELKRLMRVYREHIEAVATACSIEGRRSADIAAFLTDLSNSRGKTLKMSNKPRALALRRKDRTKHYANHQTLARNGQLNSLLFAREVAGRFTSGRTRQLLNFTNDLCKFREDSLQVRNEWTNCAGDVTTISWASDDAFICGTTTHMDNRNHQYNRQGNLALGSVRAGTLRAYPDHRILRPQATNPSNPENASAYPNSQSYDDPWLYTSVVSSDYLSTHDLAFTSGFDHNVKVWRVDPASDSMVLMSTWRHEGKVNFVVASAHPAGLVATAADVPINSIRAYRLPSAQTGGRLPYKMFSCTRDLDLEGRPLFTDKWGYCPAAVRWGLADGTQHLLLVGFSPRGLDDASDDENIPEERRNTGQLCLWDGVSGESWSIWGGTMQNVFEVAWHPTQLCFAAATTPVGQAVEANIRTQIRVYRPSNNTEHSGRVYSEVQTLDCFADDINELALLPIGSRFFYAAAGCTNGRTYVWDTSQGDKPIHTLAHGRCIEELSGERISVEDTGVKFVAWGQTPDRLYTGSSDGVVKVWNIRSHRLSEARPFVRNVLECPAPVSFGAFSPSNSKLAVGDASGRVFLLSVEDSKLEQDEEEDEFISDDENRASGSEAHHGRTHLGSRQGSLLAATVGPRSRRTFRQHPPEIIRHPTPPPPIQPPLLGTEGAAAAAAAAAVTGTGVGQDGDDGSSLSMAQAFLALGQLVVVPDRTVGAVKGPHYAQTNLFCRPFHLASLPENPLLAQYERVQQENRPRASSSPSGQRPLRDVFWSDEAYSSIDFDGSAHDPGGESDDNEDGGSNDSTDDGLFVPQTTKKLWKKRVIRQTLSLHRCNMARDLNISNLSADTRRELELADRAALLHIDSDLNDGFAYEEMPAEL